jgi:hypothetical protein
MVVAGCAAVAYSKKAEVPANAGSFSFVRMPPCADMSGYKLKEVVMMFSGLSQGLYLLSFGLGYFVLYVARKSEKGLAFLGYFVGTFLLVVSMLMFVTSLFEINDLMSTQMPRMHHYKMMMPPSPMFR